MTRQRTFSALVAVAVALLGLDLVLRLSPQEAAAQEPEFRIFPELPVPEPKVVSVSVGHDLVGCSNGPCASGAYRIFRSWLDGQVDMTWAVFGIHSEPCTLLNQCAPVVVIPGI